MQAGTVFGEFLLEIPFQRGSLIFLPLLAIGSVKKPINVPLQIFHIRPHIRQVTPVFWMCVLNNNVLYSMWPFSSDNQGQMNCILTLSRQSEEPKKLCWHF